MMFVGKVIKSKFGQETLSERGDRDFKTFVYGMSLFRIFLCTGADDNLANLQESLGKIENSGNNAKTTASKLGQDRDYTHQTSLQQFVQPFKVIVTRVIQQGIS